jgi:hypothetical protein
MRQLFTLPCHDIRGGLSASGPWFWGRTAEKRPDRCLDLSGPEVLVLYRKRSGGALFGCAIRPIAGAFSIQRLEGSRFGGRTLWTLNGAGGVGSRRRVEFNVGSVRFDERRKEIPNRCPRGIQLMGTLRVIPLAGAANPSWKRSCHDCWGMRAGGERNLNSTAESRSNKTIGPPHSGHCHSGRAEEGAHVVVGRAVGIAANN